MTTTIAERIQSRLKKLNLSMRKASLKAGLSDGFIRNIILGKSESPRGINLTKLANALNTSELWLLSGDGPEDVDNPDEAHAAENVEFLELWKRYASEQDRQVILALLRSRRDAKH